MISQTAADVLVTRVIVQWMMSNLTVHNGFIYFILNKAEIKDRGQLEIMYV